MLEKVEQVQWCSVCNERPSDGTLTILLDGRQVDIPACELCVINPEKVEFIK